MRRRVEQSCQRFHRFEKVTLSFPVSHNDLFKTCSAVSGPAVNERPKPVTVEAIAGGTAAGAPPVKQTTIAEIIKESPNVPLQTVVYKMRGGYVNGQPSEVEITFQAPPDTKVDPRE